MQSVRRTLRASIRRCGRHPGKWPAALVAFVSGCASLGPRTLPSDHLGYNKAVADSTNEQLLLNLVRLGDERPMYFVEIDAIVSQFSLSAGTTWSRWQNDLHGVFGPILRTRYPASGDDLLDPAYQTSLGASLRHSQTPTIAYRTIEDSVMFHRLMQPIPPEAIVGLIQSGWGIDRVLGCCAQRINGIPNPAFDTMEGCGPVDGDSFETVLCSLKRIQDHGALRVCIEVSDGRPQAVLHVPDSDPDVQEDLSKLRSALGSGTRGPLRLRITSNFEPAASNELALNTCSLLAVMTALARPREAFAGATEQSPAAGTAAECDSGQAAPKRAPWLWIRCSRSPEAASFVQVRHDSRWHYIPQSDWSSKRTFALLASLHSMLVGPSTRSAGPITTVGVN